MVTLDGFFEGPGRDISWHNVDEEFNEFAVEQLDKTDLLIFGRVTYELMADYWSTETALKNDPIIAEKMNSLPKIVFSKTMNMAVWNNTKLIRQNASAAVSKMKQLPGGEIGIFGSSILSSSLIRDNLIDEFRIIVNPKILGSGRPLFGEISEVVRLRLVNMRTFRSGNVLLCYEPYKLKGDV